MSETRSSCNTLPTLLVILLIPQFYPSCYTWNERTQTHDVYLNLCHVWNPLENSKNPFFWVQTNAVFLLFILWKNQKEGKKEEVCPLQVLSIFVFKIYHITCLIPFTESLSTFAFKSIYNADGLEINGFHVRIPVILAQYLSCVADMHWLAIPSAVPKKGSIT